MTALLLAALCLGVLAVAIRRRRGAAPVGENAEERFRVLTQATNDVIWDWDLLADEIWRNDRLTSLFGYRPEQVKPDSAWWRACIHPEDLERVVVSLQAALQRGEPLWTEEYRFRQADGAYRHVLDRGYILRNAAGKPVRIVGAMIDVTDRKQSERRERDQADRLGGSNRKLVEQQGVMQSLLEDLQATKLRLEEQARAMQTANQRLKELSAIKDEFVAKASHELRTPMTAIKEGISLMLDKALGPINAEQQDFLQIVDENIDRLSELINNLLDLSKIEAGRLRLLRRRLDVRQLITTTLNSYKAIAGRRAMKAELTEAPDVLADPNRVLQVLGNLFSNAVKFTADTGTIVFTVQQRAGAVAISVQDDGIGISDSDLPRLFQKFSQVGEGIEKPRGTGLGLALCKELVELHKGTLSVASRQGQGTVFTFTLPVYTPQLALREGFDELVQVAKQGEEEAVGLVALDASPLLKLLGKPGVARRIARVSDAAEFIRGHVHRGDIVLDIAPNWVVVLGVMDEHGIPAVIERLRKAIRELDPLVAGTPMSFGSALYPMHGKDVEELFAHATRALGATPAAGTPPAVGAPRHG